MITTLVSIAMAVIIAVIVLIVTHPIKKSLKNIDDQKREETKDRKIMHAKIDCIVFGLKQMNGNTSVKFGHVYDENLKYKMEELKYISHD